LKRKINEDCKSFQYTILYIGTCFLIDHNFLAFLNTLPTGSPYLNQVFHKKYAQYTQLSLYLYIFTKMFKMDHLTSFFIVSWQLLLCNVHAIASVPTVISGPLHPFLTPLYNGVYAYTERFIPRCLHGKGSTKTSSKQNCRTFFYQVNLRSPRYFKTSISHFHPRCLYKVSQIMCKHCSQSLSQTVRILQSTDSPTQPDILVEHALFKDFQLLFLLLVFSSHRFLYFSGLLTFIVCLFNIK
jgi:hypothetical protein